MYSCLLCGSLIDHNKYAVFISGLSVPLIYYYMSFFCVPAPHCFDYCSFVVQYQVSKHDSSSSLFFLQIVLTMQDLSCLRTNFKIIFSSPVKNAIAI